MPISLILTPFDHFHFRLALAVKCIPDLRVRLKWGIPEKSYKNVRSSTALTRWLEGVRGVLEVCWRFVSL